MDTTPFEHDRAVRDDEGAIDPEKWVDRYGDALFRYAVSKLRDTALSEEIVQETFLAGLQALHKFRRDSSVSTWLFSILRRKVADHYRSRLPSSTTHAESTDARQAAEAGKRRSADWKADPAVIFEDQEFWRTFDSCVDRLTDKLAEAYMLREINGYAPHEICKILGISATSLSMRLHRCRVAIRDCLTLHWFQPDD